jgi:hypothetical protein
MTEPEFIFSNTSEDGLWEESNFLVSMYDYSVTQKKVLFNSTSQ